MDRVYASTVYGGANDVKRCVCVRRKERFSGLISVIKSSVRAVKAGRT